MALGITGRTLPVVIFLCESHRIKHPRFFILIGIEVIYDRIRHRQLYRLNDAISNISCGIFEQITGVFAKVFTVALYAFIYDHWRLFTIPDAWYTFIILFLAVDFAYYWAHRKSHEINLFWIGHVVHHQSEEYNLSVALRQGALQKVFTSVFYLPIALLGFSPEYFLLMAAINTLYQFWIHTEAIGKLGLLEWVMNTPSHHRVHHGRNPKYIDRNHAGVFIIWDKMFGTFEAEEEHPVYGITTPVRTWDALTSHVRPFENLVRDWKLVKEWKYRIQLLFMKPGWLPAKYGGYREPPDVREDTYVKFETKLNKQMNWYLLVHFFSFFQVHLSFCSIFQKCQRRSNGLQWWLYPIPSCRPVGCLKLKSRRSGLKCSGFSSLDLLCSHFSATHLLRWPWQFQFSL